MQIEIESAIREFFNEYLSRKPTEAEVLELHDEYTRDYEGMVEHANKAGLTYNTLIKRCLIDAFAEEIQQENDSYKLYLEFINASTLLEAAITKFKESAEAILKSPHTGKVVDMVSSNTDLKVTVLEPQLLKVFLDDAFKACNDATLKEMVLRKDPTLSKKGSDNVAWFPAIGIDDRVTVTAIKRVREIFNPALVSIQEGKRIVEMVLDGTISVPQ